MTVQGKHTLAFLSDTLLSVSHGIVKRWGISYSRRLVGLHRTVRGALAGRSQRDEEAYLDSSTSASIATRSGPPMFNLVYTRNRTFPTPAVVRFRGVEDCGVGEAGKVSQALVRRWVGAFRGACCSDFLLVCRLMESVVMFWWHHAMRGGHPSRGRHEMLVVFAHVGNREVSYEVDCCPPWQS